MKFCISRSNLIAMWCWIAIVDCDSTSTQCWSTRWIVYLSCTTLIWKPCVFCRKCRNGTIIRKKGDSRIKKYLSETNHHRITIGVRNHQIATDIIKMMENKMCRVQKIGLSLLLGRQGNTEYFPSIPPNLRTTKLFWVEFLKNYFEKAIKIHKKVWLKEKLNHGVLMFPFQCHELCRCELALWKL